MKNAVHSIATPSGSEAVSADTLLMTLTGSLVLLLLVVLSLIWVWRRSGLMPRPARQAGIHIVSTRSLGGRERLVMVETAGRRLLLGVTAGQITCLDAEDKPVTAQETAAETVSFPGVMEAIRQRCSGEKK